MCHRSKRCHFKDVSTNGNKKKIKAYFRGCGRGIRWKTFHRCESETEGQFRIKVNFLIETEIHSRRIRSIDSRDTPTSSGPARQQLDGLINSLVKTRLSLYFPLKNKTTRYAIQFHSENNRICFMRVVVAVAGRRLNGAEWYRHEPWTRPRHFTINFIWQRIIMEIMFFDRFDFL